MHKKGLWAVESKKVIQLAKKLIDFERDVASSGPLSPRDYIHNIRTELDVIREKIEHPKRHSFFDTRVPAIKLQLESCYESISRLEDEISSAEIVASNIVYTCQEITSELSEIFTDIQNRRRKYQSSSLITPPINREFTVFDKIKNAGYSTWDSILRTFRNSPDSVDLVCHQFSDSTHNTLNRLVFTPDSDFVALIESGDISIDGEMGHLIIQRLRQIVCASVNSKKSIPPVQAPLINKIGGILNRAMDVTNPESILRCDYDALKNELTKLSLHASLHPDKKVFWLGTARAVDMTLKASPGEGTYLNCDDNKWSWHLNRLWLHAAVHLGYNCKLVEQHYPDVREAVLSNDVSFFVLQLLRATRKQGTHNSSQYNGDETPTATAQEMLVLMDIGCCGSESADKSLMFTRAKVVEEPKFIKLGNSSSFDEEEDQFDEELFRQLPSIGLVSRSYSDGTNSASPAVPFPVGSRGNQFFLPTASNKIREQRQSAVNNFRNL